MTENEILQAAHERYQQDADEKALLSTGVYLGLHRLADGYHNSDVKAALSAGQHIIKGATETLIGRLFDPHHETANESAPEEMIRRSSEWFFRDMEPIGAYIARLFGFKW